MNKINRDKSKSLKKGVKLAIDQFKIELISDSKNATAAQNSLEASSPTRTVIDNKSAISTSISSPPTIQIKPGSVSMKKKKNTSKVKHLKINRQNKMRCINKCQDSRELFNLKRIHRKVITISYNFSTFCFLQLIM